MKRFKLISLLGVLLLVSLGYSADITFTSSGSIVDEDVFNLVQVQNSGTVVNMTGGQINYLHIYNSSVFNMSAGQIKSMIITSFPSTFNFSGGTITATDFQFGGIVNISGGNITGNGKFATPYSSVVNVTGGVLNFFDFMVYGETNIYGGLLNIDNFEYSGGITNIFGYEFDYDSVRQVLTGYLSDGNQFIINQVNSFDYQHINFVPEPATFLLFSLGGLLLRKQS